MEQPELIPKTRRPRSDKGRPRVIVREIPPDESPVRIRINGEEYRCTAWSIEARFLKMSYWPEARGRQGTRYIALERIMDMEIEEPMGASPQLPAVVQPAAVPGPQQYVNPLIGRRDPLANTARIVKVPDAQNPVPQTEIVDENGGRSIVEAAILS